MRKLLLSLFLLLFLPSAVQAGWAEVGSGSQAHTALCDGTDTCDNVFPGSVTSGNLIVAIGVAWTSGSAPAAISVTSTCSAALIVKSSVPPFTSPYERMFIAYGPATSSAACTVTVDPSGSSSYIAYAVNEYSGGGILDVDASGNNGSGTAVTQDITTVAANSLVLGVMIHSGGVNEAVTEGGSYTLIGEEEDNLTHIVYNAVFRIVTSATTYTVDWTTATGHEWGTHVISLAPTVAAGSSFRRSMFIQ